MGKRLQTGIFFAVVLLAGAGVAFNMLWQPEPPPLKFPDMEGVIVESPPTPLPRFSLRDQQGRPFTRDNYRGQWSIVFFGYTSCPDICPTTMGNMDRLSRAEGMPPTQFVFHTVDPRRDTPEKLAEYVSYFNEDFIAVTGDKDEIDKFAEPLGVIYDFEGDTASDDYIVTHFAAVYIIDPKARLRAYVLPPHDVARMKKVYLKVREYYGG